ncbi:MAG TPA: patatin-like phospholipase family protein [Thermoanaerobaculia bacterium]|nr:patatin-like phospholipase family protein [Thermoanaerobaculia bacterium]
MPLYENADRCCDLVMKGGITSGILYPPAICRIAERFHLISIGGTSAGAIAACAAAAAEYRRRTTGTGDGFERLERLPWDLAGEGRLLGLFRPDRATRAELELLLRALDLGENGWLGRLGFKTRLLWAGVRHKTHIRRVVDNDFGLCSGMANENPPGAGEIAPITQWLAQTLDEIAGKDDGSPLTFGDLRRAPQPAALRELGGKAQSIDLRAMTTCVSFGRPLELPFDGTRIFAFDEAEWRRLFPAYVVDHIVRVAREIDARSFAGTGKLPFPVGDEMPVVVAARMSLSFPALFSAVPLHAIDFEGGGVLRKVWFSDGGITSNLPIHGFDALFPLWPTLAINLQSTDEDGKPARSSVDAEELLYMIARREDGTRDLWNLFDDRGSATRNLIGFGGAVFRSAQVWHDNSYLKLPGYRDRVLEIWLRKEEGGMNLHMKREVIEGLIARGSAAGIKLRDRFAETPSDDPLSWDGHRWVRLRSALAGLSEYLLPFERAAEHEAPHQRSLAELLSSRDAPPTAKFGSQRQYEAAKQTIEALLGYVEGISALDDVCTESDHDGGACTRPFCGGPRPPVAIGSRPRF